MRRGRSGRQPEHRGDHGRDCRDPSRGPASGTTDRRSLVHAFTLPARGGGAASGPRGRHLRRHAADAVRTLALGCVNTAISGGCWARSGSRSASSCWPRRRLRARDARERGPFRQHDRGHLAHPAPAHLRRERRDLVRVDRALRPEGRPGRHRRAAPLGDHRPRDRSERAPPLRRRLRADVARDLGRLAPGARRLHVHRRASRRSNAEGLAAKLEAKAGGNKTVGVLFAIARAASSPSSRC